MLKVGLTGGIGSGKSTIAEIFKVLGVRVFDADRAAKSIMNDNAGLREQIIQAFGHGAYSNGLLNRKYIADIVFNNPYRLEQLNALVHPAAIQAAEDWMLQQHAPYVIKEAALLFEAGSAGHLDVIIGVFAPQPLRIKRVMDRDNISRQDVMARMGRQVDDSIKMRLCDFVIVNDEQQLVLPQVVNLHKELLKKATDE
ncbi:dephospho-CoA kinase [Foetidibacter luteolus]|uniref:dephospho-CoA kinase n=1 Tax=Foetidibacter luteolus TaxID=2608880 RepID=UPI00129B28C2|nr:dephospho-CoA kinase [Foetidibacter luteolus]